MLTEEDIKNLIEAQKNFFYTKEDLDKRFSAIYNKEEMDKQFYTKEGMDKRFAVFYTREEMEQKFSTKDEINEKFSSLQTSMDAVVKDKKPEMKRLLYNRSSNFPPSKGRLGGVRIRYVVIG